MPIYEYECKLCGTRQIEVRSVLERNDPFPCQSCGGDTVRIMSPSTFHLRGPGWSKDGYASHYGDLPENKALRERAKAEIKRNKNKC